MADTLTHPPCSKCGKSDDHPRHLLVRVMDVATLAPAGTSPERLAELERVYNSADHLDCCGCHAEDDLNLPAGFESCRDVVARADGAKGPDLAAHLDASPRNLGGE